MKIWMNDLKEGDMCYVIQGENVLYCKILGDANNMSYRMPRVKLEAIDMHTHKPIYEFEQFVNSYAYDNYEEAIEVLLNDLHTKIGKLRNEREMLNDHINYIQIYIDKYSKLINKEDEFLDYPYLGGTKAPNKLKRNLSEAEIESIIGG